MPTALVTGATGILGREIVSALGKDSSTWTSVWALSRSQSISWPSNVTSKHLDLTSSAAEMAEQLGPDVKPDYIFFAAYLAKDSEEDATKVNGDMLENFLEALQITGADKGVKRVVLTTGAKQYGVHLGVPKNPMEESDKWLNEEGENAWPPNFYYRQQRILKAKAEKQGWTWVVTYPNDVIGVAKGNFMNLITSLGIYAAVTKAMGEGFVFPGSPTFYSRFDCFTYSRLHAQFNLWAALSENDKVANQAFNVVNGDTESWQNLWPKVASKFGLHVPDRMFDAREEWPEAAIDESKGGSVQKLAAYPPLKDFAAERGLLGSSRLEQSKVEQKIDLVKWSQREDVKAAWKQLAERKGLEHEAFEKATWGFLGFVLGRNFDLVISMSKARKAGWTGYADTWDSISESLDDLVDEKVLPAFT